MATQVQFRRGTTAQSDSFTGASGEININTDKNTIRVHDGSTQGGFELARADLTNISNVGVLTATTFDGNLTGEVNSSGVSTFSNVVVGAATTELVVTGDVRITGILTVGTGSVTINGTNDSITIGSGLTITASGNGDFGGDVTVGGTLSATSLSGPLNGNVTGNLTGNADTATALETARTIGGVSFDGTSNINLPGVNTSGNQDTSGNAATATALETSRSIALSGDVSGSASFDGSSNVTITATVADDSHNHVISNVDGLQSSLDLKAPLASPALTGTPTAPTAAAGTNTTQVATTAFVSTAVSNLVDSAPGTLDTLNELAAALGDDPNFATTVTNSIGTKLPLSGGQLTGNITFSGTQTVDGRDLSVDGAKLDGIESGATADQTASEILTAIKTVDGASSGLDADLLDGQEGSYYRNASNINAGTIGDAYLPATISSDITGNAGTATTTTNIPNLSGDITSANTVTTLATVNSNVGTFGNGSSIPTITVNGKGLITAVSTTSVDPANDGTLTLATSGTGLSGSATFTANQSGNSTFTVTSNATSNNTNSTIVARDSSGNFSAGTITASLSGNATSATTATTAGSCSGNAATATKLATARSIGLGGGVSGSASFDGSANITITATVANDSHTHDGRYYTESESDTRFLQRGVGTWHTSSDGRQRLYFANVSHTYLKSSDNIYFRTENSDTDNCYVASGSITCVDLNSTSDINLKKDIEIISNANEILSQINGIKFSWRSNDKKSVGVIAQEVEKVLPELVVVSENDEKTKTVNYQGLIGVLIEAVKDQQKQINALKEEIELLKQ
jgi:hypothetical protein